MRLNGENLENTGKAEWHPLIVLAIILLSESVQIRQLSFIICKADQLKLLLIDGS